MPFSRVFRTAYRLAACLALVACTHNLHLMKMEEQIGRYGGLMRWSEFRRALAFYAHPPAVDWQLLKEIKVTGYQPVSRDLLDDDTTVLQTVEIRYVKGDGVVVRTLIDEQRWRYEDETGRWLLESEFPKFQ
ncbi:hypothetical protein [Candidatus Methylocalor cossyra]|uniref:Lipoprotein n=1 Tax=Candidatus Methylocalor cossyra TaxID=3108543 RepID=A0ABP1C4D0_9GAMM